MPSKPTVRNRERGSALLIVFLFAAVLAISLYIEMPSYAFEAKRAKEQLLVDRGNEYAHAVKLYYRKFRAYPASIKALESTNNLRFLRHAFKDPMTGENDWRLLHAGPGGMLTDSKVTPIGLNANGQNTTGLGSNSSNNSSSSASASASNTAFGSPSASPDSTASASANGMMLPAGGTGLPQRPPEMPINGGGGVTTSSNPANVDPTQSLLPLTPAGSTAPSGNANGLSPTAPVLAGQPGAGAPNSGNPMQGVQQLYANPNPPTLPGVPGTTGPAAPLPLPSGQTVGGATIGTSSTTSTSSGMAVLQSGGLAGVASIAKGTSIKTVNDQTDYSLWEFYYDPTKDTSAVGQQSGVNPMNGVNLPNNNPLNSNTGSSSSSNSNSSNTSTSPSTLQPTPMPAPTSTSTSTQPQQP